MPRLRGKNCSMTQPEITPAISSSFKIFLFLMAVVFAIAAVILVFFTTSAATAAGSAPAMAVSLVSGPNTGLLGPGEQRWFRLTTGQDAFLPQSLSLIFTPDNGQRASRINLQIFTEQQMPWFYFGDTSKMANLGAGQVVIRDHNPETGELFWTGWLPGQSSYYIQVQNGSDAPIDYWLFPADVSNYPLGEK